MNPSTLPRRRLGRTGYDVTALGLGGAHLGRTESGFDDELAVATVHRALALGINLIDTAPYYGDSQRRIGLALSQWYERGGRRDELYLSTKTGRLPDGQSYYSADETYRGVEDSLRLLDTDYLDMVLVHDPSDLTPVLETGGALEALVELRQQGVIRAIGAGLRPHVFHQRLMETGQLDVCLTFCDYNLLDQSAATGVLEPAAEHDVGVLNGAAVMLGLLGGKDPRVVARRLGGFATDQRVTRAVELWQWARQSNVSLLAVNLQFCMREMRIGSTLVGAATPAEVEADVAAACQPLPEATWGELRDRFGIG